MIMPIIILKKLKPSPLAKIQLFLGEHVLKSLLICKHIYINTIQVVSLYIVCKYYSCKLEVMCWIVLLMNLKLFRGISYHLTSLHQHTT